MAVFDDLNKFYSTEISTLGTSDTPATNSAVSLRDRMKNLGKPTVDTSKQEQKLADIESTKKRELGFGYARILQQGIKDYSAISEEKRAAMTSLDRQFADTEHAVNMRQATGELQAAMNLARGMTQVDAQGQQVEAGRQAQQFIRDPQTGELLNG